MNILITRPYDLAINSQNKISKLGKKSIVVPFILIKHLGIKIEDDDYNYIVLTSQNAIDAFENNPWMKNKLILVVGSKTKELLLKKGCKEILLCEMNVNDLINSIYRTIPIPANILYICGDYLSYDLKSSLKSKGYSVKSKVVYNSGTIIELSKDEIAQINKSVKIVMFYSPRTAQIFTDLVLKHNIYTINKVAICISEKCADNIVNLQWRKVKIASTSNETKMLELI